GYSNIDSTVVPYRSNFLSKVVYEDDSFGRLYFDNRGFLDTINWLEQGCRHYRYSEDVELILIKYRPIITHRPFSPRTEYSIYADNFDLQNMIIYNLDLLKKDGINTLRMITECKKVSSDTHSEREVKNRLENFIFDRTCSPERHWHQNIKVFVAGSKTLKLERDAVISALSYVSNYSSRDYAFRVITYEHFDRSLSEEGRQKEYNDYIFNEAEYAIFILDNTVGGITFEEFKVARNAYLAKRKPEIFVYSRISDNQDSNSHEQPEEITAIIKNLSEMGLGQYYIEYKDIDDLKNHIKHDFRRYSL
ncbi:MAG: hypothetical protein IKV33_01170, partial [Alistipes sp.]|nr:hypothetical protein [Alistipes sp.]